MNTSNDYTALSLTPMYRLVGDKTAGMELYRIISGRACEKVVCFKAVERSCGDFSFYIFDLLVRLKNNTKHSLAIRFLERMEDLGKFREHPFDGTFEYKDDDGEWCISRPYTRLTVYFLLSGNLPGGKTVCRVGFPTGEDDLEDYRPETPTMIISTEGEGDDSEISRLARYLRCPEPGNPQFGPIGQVVERWIADNSNSTEGGNKNG